MTKHNHVDDIQAQEVATQMIQGQNGLIVACSQCRDEISEKLFSLLACAPRPQAELIPVFKYQMEIMAHHYREAVRHVQNKTVDTTFMHNKIERLSRLPVLNDKNQLLRSVA